MRSLPARETAFQPVGPPGKGANRDRPGTGNRDRNAVYVKLCVLAQKNENSLANYLACAENNFFLVVAPDSRVLLPPSLQ